MAYIGNVSAFEVVGTSELKDGSVTAAKINSAVALGGPVTWHCKYYQNQRKHYQREHHDTCQHQWYDCWPSNNS